MSTPTSQSVITDALSTFRADALPILASGLGVGVTVLAVKRGWRWVKGLIG